ncbi:MAG: ATP-dependent zinc metalloprotease FtsH [Flavobacteriales bacterium]
MAEQQPQQSKNKIPGEPRKPGQPSNPFGNRPEDSNKKSMNFYWVYALIAMVLITMMVFNSNSEGTEIAYQKFKGYAEKGYVEKIEYNQGQARVYLDSLGLAELKGKYEKQTSMTAMSRGSEFWFTPPINDNIGAELEILGVQYNFQVSHKPVNEFGQSILFWIIGIGVMILAWVILMRRLGGPGGPGGQIFNIGKSRAQLFDKSKSTAVTFNDVAGLEGAKQEVQEIVDFLKQPKKYTELGAKIPKGALLVGPPGTGKTLLAKAVAGEAQVPFFSLSGSDFVEMFVGVGASRVRDLFRQAKEKAPAIIFIDEIDAIGRARSKSINFGSNDERENTLNQLLTEMDGFATNSGIIILAATNRADILDKALLRAGRFDRQIYVDMPDVKERVQIFHVHLKNVKKDDSVDVEFLAKQTPGFSGADIANICNEAALIAARKGGATVGRQDFLDAVDRIIGGLEKKNKIITPEEKSTIAYHESGHAILSWLLEHASPLVKVTIVPRGRSLGAAWYLPEERQITTTEQMMDEMCAALGGRAAEEVAFGRISTGALSDLEKVTKQAYAMVSIFGLNKKIGNRSYYDSSGESQFTKPYSEETARVIDEEVSKVIERAYEKAKDLLLRNKEKLDALAKKLLDKEVIFKDDLVEVLGARPWAERETLELKPVVAQPQ